MTRQYVGTPTNVYRGWHIDHYSPPIPTRNCDWSATHPDFDGEGDNRQVWAASYAELLTEIDAWIAENTTYGLIDPTPANPA